MVLWMRLRSVVGAPPQVGKGRDVGLNQIALFEAKVASGNGEQLLSRDVYRLGQLFDFFRMLSFFFTSVGFYVTTMVSFHIVWPRSSLCGKFPPFPLPQNSPGSRSQESARKTILPSNWSITPVIRWCDYSAFLQGYHNCRLPTLILILL